MGDIKITRQREATVGSLETKVIDLWRAGQSPLKFKPQHKAPGKAITRQFILDLESQPAVHVGGCVPLPSTKTWQE